MIKSAFVSAIQRSAAVVVAVGVCAVSAGAQTASDASKEGQVVWYAAPGTSAQIAPALVTWNKLHPDIKVEIVEAPGPDMMERVSTEIRSKHNVADLMSLGDIAAWPAVQQGLYQPFTKALVPNAFKLSPRVKEFLDKDQRIVPIYLLAYGITVNTQTVPQSDWPQSWKDILKPQFANTIGIHDFSIIGGGLVWYMVGQKPLGEAFYKQLVDNKPRVFSRLPEQQSAVNNGQRSIVVPGSLQAVTQAKGAPVKWIAPRDGIFVITYYNGVVHGAPHPTAAQVFLNFLLTQEAQHAAALTGDVPVIPTPDSPLDLGKAKFLGYGATTAIQGQNMAEWLKAGKSLMGQ